MKWVIEENIGWIGSFVKEWFQNDIKIKNVRVPTLFIHGKEDQLVSLDHSVNLSSKSLGPSSLHISIDMDHNNFRTHPDLIK